MNRQVDFNWFMTIISSPEPKAHWWAYRIGRPPSSDVRPLAFRRSHSLNTFFSETTGPIEAKCHMESPLDGGTKVCLNGPGHMAKVAAMPIYGKKILNLLLRNQKANGLETWYATLGVQVLSSLFKLWPLVDLDLFYGKVKFGLLFFYMGKS